jgi:hypothetical protein
MAEAPPPRVLIDACVLYPGTLRRVVLGCAAAGLIRPSWSPRILAEWAHAAGRGGPAAAAEAAAEIARLRAERPAAEVLPDPDVEAALDLPDRADAHVLAAALAAGADLILTRNLADFPARALEPHGLRAEAPDALLMRLWLADGPAVAAAVGAALAAAQGGAGPRQALKRAGLPRLGKALNPA